jgi:invasion protein IalB
MGECTLSGCFAEAAVTDNLLKSGASARIVELTLRNADGQDESLPASFHGFAKTLDAVVHIYGTKAARRVSPVQTLFAIDQ